MFPGSIQICTCIFLRGLFLGRIHKIYTCMFLGSIHGINIHIHFSETYFLEIYMKNIFMHILSIWGAWLKVAQGGSSLGELCVGFLDARFYVLGGSPQCAGFSHGGSGAVGCVASVCRTPNSIRVVGCPQQLLRGRHDTARHPRNQVDGPFWSAALP